MQNRLRIGVIVGVVAALGLAAAGCGSDDDSAATTGPTAATSDASDATTAPSPTTGDRAGSADTAPDPAAAPERVVLVDYYSLPDMLEVGVTPVGVPEDLEAGLTAEQLATYESIDKVGIVGDLNFEKIAELEPDLIIGVDSYNGDDYDTLAAIAPTVLIPFASSGDWPALAHQVADLVGKSAEMDALQATYEDASSTLATDHADALASTTWDIVSGGLTADGAGTTFVWLGNSTAGVVMTTAGFQLAEASSGTSENGFVELSDEQLGMLGDADAIVTLADDDGTLSESSESLVAQPLFASLPAAQSGNVFPVIQMFPASYGQATVLLAELAEALSQI